MWCMILTMTTVGYGEIYPVTIFGRIFTIIACIWGMFNMSMLIVSLTGIIAFTPEEEQSYNEIVTTDKEVVDKMRTEAATLIQSFFRYVLTKIRLRHEKFAGEKLKTLMDFIALTKRSKYKRLNITKANPQLSSIISEFQGRIDEFNIPGMKRLHLLKNQVTKQIGQMRGNQFEMDVKMLKLYDTTMRLNSFVIGFNKGKQIEGSEFATFKELYTQNKNKMKVNKVKEYLVLFKDAREPTNKFFEGYRQKD